MQTAEGAGGMRACQYHLRGIEAFLVSPVEEQDGRLAVSGDAQPVSRADQHEHVLAPGEARVEIAVPLDGLGHVQVRPGQRGLQGAPGPRGELGERPRSRDPRFPPARCGAVSVCGMPDGARSRYPSGPASDPDAVSTQPITHHPATRNVDTTHPPASRPGRCRGDRPPGRATSPRRHARTARLAGVCPEAPGRIARAPPRRSTSLPLPPSPGILRRPRAPFPRPCEARARAPAGRATVPATLLKWLQHPAQGRRAPCPGGRSAACGS